MCFSELTLSDILIRLSVKDKDLVSVLSRRITGFFGHSIKVGVGDVIGKYNWFSVVEKLLHPKIIEIVTYSGNFFITGGGHHLCQNCGYGPYCCLKTKLGVCQNIW